VTGEAGSGLVAVLERSWEAIRERCGEVPEVVVVVVAAGSEGKGLKLGHFAASRWHLDGAQRAEVLVGGEGLRRGAVDVLGTLLHEAAHGLAQVRGVRDTSRGGRYHNRRYRSVAEELGLEVVETPPIGWSGTTVPPAMVAAYKGAVAELDEALVLWRVAEQRGGRGSRSRNLPVCVCGCPRRIRVAAATLDLAPIVCGACDQPFAIEDASEVDD